MPLREYLLDAAGSEITVRLAFAPSLAHQKPISMGCPRRSRAWKGGKMNDPEEGTSRADLLALLRKSLIISGAGEGNRTLVIITKSVLLGNFMISA